MKKLMTNAEWENFVKGDVVNFLLSHDLQSIQVSDGNGKKGKVTVTGKGEHKISITLNEMM